MKKIVLLTPGDAAHGFALAGVRHLTCATAQVPAVLHEIARDALAGVVIVDERLLDAPVRELIRVLDRRWQGLVIALPAPRRAAPTEEDYVLQLIRRAIGYQVRLT